jgi:hypothetical protein
MVKINLKRFSRSKVDDENTNIINPEIVEEVPKKRRGRPPRSKPIEDIDTEPEVSEPEPELHYNTPDDISEVSLDNNFLSDLNADNYKEPPTQQEIKQEEKQQKAQKRSYDKLFKEIQKQQVKAETRVTRQPKSRYEDDNSLFDDQGTELIGREKRLLLAKIQQYKNLFPDELSKFKIKKNCSTADLQLYLSEMESIVDTSSVEQFLSDSIIQCIKLTEGISTYTKYDITGCADLLKSNKQFHTLTKQMYIKYKVFDKVPPEWQLTILIATTAYICKNKNVKKKEIENFLNQPIIPPTPTTNI